MNDIIQFTTDELIKSLEKGSITQSWDIVCSYSLEQINENIKNMYDEDRLIKNFKKTFDEPDDFDDDVFKHYSYNVDFGLPLLQFNPASTKNCILILPIKSGSLTVTKDGSTKSKEYNISKDKYEMKCTVPFRYIYGDKKKQDTSEAFVFPLGDPTKVNIAIHFEFSSSADIDIVPIPKGEDEQDIKDRIFLKSFTTSFIDYIRHDAKQIEIILAGVTNEKPSKCDDIVIDPKKFIFSTTIASEEKGSLNIFIQTKNSGLEPGVKEPKVILFDEDIKHDDILPIPDGKSASLFFSPHFLENAFFKPSLLSQGFVDFKANHDEKTNVAFGACWDKEVTYTPDKDFITSFFGPIDLDFDKGSIFFNKDPFNFKFDTNNINVKADIKGSIKWHLTEYNGWTQKNSHEHGTATSDLLVDKSQEIKDHSTFTQSNIDINFDVVPEDFTIEVDSGTTDSCWDAHSASKIEKDIKDKLKDHLPTVNFNMTGLYYFNITNLLFPGKQTINFDTSLGLKFPSDCFMTGDMIEFEKEKEL